MGVVFVLVVVVVVDNADTTVVGLKRVALLGFFAAVTRALLVAGATSFLWELVSYVIWKSLRQSFLDPPHLRTCYRMYLCWLVVYLEMGGL